MKIEGLEYNTEREKLFMFEYGRVVQNMIKTALEQPTKQIQQAYAEKIIQMMRIASPQIENEENYTQRLWDHLALMSNYKLDIDYPVDVSKAMGIARSPDKILYTETRIPIRYYGNLVFSLIDKINSMDEGDERNKLVILTAKQMKRDLITWGTGSTSNEKIVADLEKFTNGKVTFNPNILSNIQTTTQQKTAKKKKKK